MESSETLNRNAHVTTQVESAPVRHSSSRSRAESAADSPQIGAATNAFLRRLYGPILEPLQSVEQRLRAEMQSPYESIAPLLRHGIQLGGKRLRPAIHLLMAEALGGVRQSNIVIASVLEMVHTATLVHDDVLDDATTRRHVPTINAQWNNHTSILLGDYLFAQSFRLAATLDNTRTCQWVGEAARLVCEGELRQVFSRSDWHLDEATYFEVIQGKTAELCRVACALAAAEADCSDERVEQLAEFGTSLGIAFQIADDFLDLWGDDATVGKTLGTDLQQGKITLPVIRLLETCDEKDRTVILSILEGPSAARAAALRPWLERSDARDYTATTARDFKQRALQSIDWLPQSEAKRCLKEIAEFSVERSF
ncbi:MAG: polyprenyl synthetase family protein [Planctomycetota bacterium]